eukprot:6198276-Pleurochrysis_carterae.AAC.1
MLLLTAPYRPCPTSREAQCSPCHWRTVIASAPPFCAGLALTSEFWTPLDGRQLQTAVMAEAMTRRVRVPTSRTRLLCARPRCSASLRALTWSRCARARTYSFPTRMLTLSHVHTLENWSHTLASALSS